MGIAGQRGQQRAVTFHGVAVTALSAFTCPWPLNALYPIPPWQTCGAPLLTDGNGS